MIRRARLSDLSDLWELFDEAYEGTPFQGMPYNQGYVERLFTTCLENPKGFFCMVVEYSGKVVGVLIAMLDRTFWGHPVVQSIISYSRRDTHLLVKKVTEWAHSRDAKMLTLATVPGKGRYEQLVDTMGFIRSGNLYTKVF